MISKIENYRGVEITGETIRRSFGGEIPQLTKRFYANPKAETVHGDSLAGIKKRIDEVLDRKD
jgi:hypothetical protein